MQKGTFLLKEVSTLHKAMQLLNSTVTMSPGTPELMQLFFLAPGYMTELLVEGGYPVILAYYYVFKK